MKSYTFHKFYHISTPKSHPRSKSGGHSFRRHNCRCSSAAQSPAMCVGPSCAAHMHVSTDTARKQNDAPLDSVGALSPPHPCAPSHMPAQGSAGGPSMACGSEWTAYTPPLGVVRYAATSPLTHIHTHFVARWVPPTPRVYMVPLRGV